MTRFTPFMSIGSMGLRAYGGEIGVHRHDHHQIVLPHRGRMDIEIDGRGGAVVAGTGVFITANTIHTFIAAPRDAFVVVDVPCLSGTTERASSAYARDAFFSICASVQGLLDHLDASLACGVLSASGRAAWTLLLVEELAREREAPPDRDQVALRRALAFLRARATTAIHVGDIAVAAGMSRTRLHGLFRTQLGTSPHAVLADLRLRAAQRLLETSDLSIAEIAVRKGYADQSVLTRCFQRKRGVTPARIRRRARGGSA
jgi:AraC-like DNA-binding protein